MNILLFLHFLHVSAQLDYLQGENVREENVKQATHHKIYYYYYYHYNIKINVM
jgi:hypothetical protein